MSHKTEAKSYDVYAVYNNGEQMKEFVVRTLLTEIPPTVNGDDYGVVMYLEGYRLGAEAIAQVEVEFEFEEVK
ncbi:MAG: hypothetical protein [Enterobacter phage ENC9]|nr:MAG: hypothetical protein [Enterobacter phage ENC9]